MLKKMRNLAVLALAVGMAVPTLAAAQSAPGARSAGMAGAFTAVADDASAVYWNPSGLATGSFVSGVIDYGVRTQAPDAPQNIGGQRDSGGMVAFAATALGFAYYRQNAFVAGPLEPAASTVSSREEVGRTVQALTTSVVGLSLVQSLGEHLIVGATPKWMTGSVRQARTTTLDVHDAIDAAASLDGASESQFDVDASVMLQANRFRLGVVGHNLATPSFAVNETGAHVDMDRRVRIGAAWGSGWTGISRVIVAVDSDVTTQRSPNGDRRDLALGVETWWKQQRFGVRGGVTRSTVGDARAAVSSGVSAAMTTGMYVDAHATIGEGGQRGWGVGVRVLY